jgi:carboxylesterase type B
VARNFNTKKEPVYRYTYSHAFGGTGTHVAGASGAYHSAETVFVFHTVDRIANPTLVTYKPTVGEGLLADQMNTYWAHFATSANPNFFEAPVWPIYDASDTYLDLNADAWSTSTISDTAFRNEDCDVWDALFPVHPHPIPDDDGRQP